LKRSGNIPAVTDAKIVIIRNFLLNKFGAFVNIDTTSVVVTQFIARFANALIRTPCIEALMSAYIGCFAFILISAKPSAAVFFKAWFAMTLI
jgi:hypothetical protein